MLHGFAGSAASWGPRLIDGLAGAGLPPTLVDLPGHGADAGTADPARFTLEAALAKIAAAGRWPEDLVGYSMGGRLALHFALAFPGRVRKLVLESASPGLETEEDRAARRAADEALARRILSEGVEWFAAHWESQPLFETRARLDANELARQTEIRLRNQARSLACALRGLGAGSLPSLWARLDRIETPTLLVVGELDAKFVDVATRMSRVMPAARLTVVQGVGHSVHLEAPGAWLDAVTGFLASGGPANRDA
jgi:2-succinyl-6-hydroxy-2,4-cyclohexadiene-1-carboxylate synthase